jgi:dihydroorotate dehydrogenase
LIKIAPDLDDAAVRDIAAIVLTQQIDGVVISNTTIQRPDYLTNQGLFYVYECL